MAELPFAVELLIQLVAADSAETFWATIAGEPSRWGGLEAAWHRLAERDTESITETLRSMEVEHDAEAVASAVTEAIGARMLSIMSRAGDGVGTA